MGYCFRVPEPVGSDFGTISFAVLIVKYCLAWFYSRRLRPCMISSTRPIYYVSVGLTSVGNDTVKHAALYVSKTTRASFGFLPFLEVGHSWRSSDTSLVRGGEPLLRTRGNDCITTRSMVRYPRARYIVLPLLSLEVAKPENKLTR